jgi:hypothetical protein
MGGALLQLVATGHADGILIGDPQITMYKTVYRRYTNFATEDVTRPMTGSGGWGSIYEFKVNRDGDMLGNQTIEVDIDPLEMAWNPSTNTEINNRLNALNIDGRPATTDNIQTWLDNTQLLILNNQEQYISIADGLINLVKLGLPMSQDESLKQILANIESNANTNTVMGTILKALTTGTLLTYWSPSIPYSSTLDFVNSLGPARETTLRLTDSQELRIALNEYLNAMILINPTSELALLDLVNNFTNRYFQLDDDYGTRTLTDILGAALVIPSDFWDLDTFKAMQFIINNSSASATTVTPQLINLTISRLTKELPLIFYYNASLLMNTLTSLSEVYGNIIYWKKPGSNFVEIPTNASGDMNNTPGNAWKNFSNANLRAFLLSDYYMVNDMNLSKNVNYVINGVTQTSSLADSSSYAHMINDTITTYTSNQSAAVISGFSDLFGNSFDSLILGFIDPWISGSVNHPLSIPALVSKFALSTICPNANYTSTDVLYFDAILFYISERFYNIVISAANISSTLTNFDKYVLTSYAGIVRDSLIALIASYLFPIAFDVLANTVNQAATPSSNPIIVYTFFKNQRVGITTIRNYWFKFLQDITDSLSGFQQQGAVAQLIIDVTFTFITLESTYILRVPVTVAPVNLAASPVTNPSPNLQASTNIDNSNGTIYNAVPNYPQMTFSDNVTTTITNPPNIFIVANPQSSTLPYKNLDNLAVFWSNINLLNSRNYSDTYANVLLDYKVITQQVGNFSGSLMYEFIVGSINNPYGLNIQFGAKFENNPDQLQAVLASDPAVSNIKNIISSTIGFMQQVLIVIDDELKKYAKNKPLLSLLTYYPTSSASLDTISSISASYINRINTNILPSYPLVDTTIVPNFFAFVNLTCYSIGELYNLIVDSISQLTPSWILDPLSVSHLTKFFKAISPATLSENTPRVLATTRDYLMFVLNNIPDGTSSIKQNIPLLDDIGNTMTIFENRADDLGKTYNNLTLLRESVISAIKNNNGIDYAWIRRLGHYMFEWIEMTIGGETWDRHTPDFLDIWYELTGKTNQKVGYDYLIGNRPETWTMNTTTKLKLHISLPLIFPHCRESGWFYPLISTQYSPMVIRCKIRDFSKCIQAPDGAYSIVRDRLGRASQGIPAIRLSMQSRYVYLDIDERKWMAANRHEYLYEYIQEHDTVTIDANTYDWGEGYKLRTYFHNPCKAFVIQTRLRSMEQTNKWTSTGWYKCTCQNTLDTITNTGLVFKTDGSLQGIPVSSMAVSDISSNTTTCTCTGGLDNGLIINSMAIEFNGVTRQQDTVGEYYAYAQSIKGWNSSPRDGIYTWNIGLQPYAPYPTGVVNMSRIDDATFVIKLNPSIKILMDAGDAVTIRIFALGYNVMRCMSGMAGRVFQH